MDKKLLNDRNRKSTNIFKYRRNKLHNQKTSQTLRKEAKEGKTYETTVGLNLDTNATQPSPTAFDIEHILDNISPNELLEYEKMVPPYAPKPNPETLTYDPTKSYSFIVFDTETTCTGKQAEICQLSAINETNLTISQGTFYQKIILVLELHESTNFPLKISMGRENYVKKTNQCKQYPLMKRYRSFWPFLSVHIRKILVQF